MEYGINKDLKIVGIGIDIENLHRFQQHLEQKNMAFFERIFSSEEIEYCLSKKVPAQHFAARFCAKEAFVKASSSYQKFKITDINVFKDGEIPKIQIWKKDSNNEALERFFNENAIMLSLSHTQQYACAQVLIQSK